MAEVTPKKAEEILDRNADVESAEDKRVDRRAQAGGDDDKTDHSDRPSWEEQSRKHEKRAKQERKRAEDLQKELEEYKSGAQTEQEKALTDAKKQARDEALEEAAKERRADRLEVAVAKHARELADVDDVILNIERAMRDGDIDEEAIFDAGGRVQTEALKTELSGLLERKPHLKAGDTSRPSGDADAGKGEGTGGDSFNDLLRR